MDTGSRIGAAGSFGPFLGLSGIPRPGPGVEAKQGIAWLKPGLILRVRYLKGEEKLRHATLREVDDR